jgi:hypothetical protein
MKLASRIFALVVALAMITAASVTALAEYGSGAVTDGGTYTTEEMLVYAIEDEYMALGEYQAIIAEYGESRPFTNLIEAEQHHIELLEPLFAEYGVTLPENDAASRVTVPDSLALAYELGIEPRPTTSPCTMRFWRRRFPKTSRMCSRR